MTQGWEREASVTFMPKRVSDLAARHDTWGIRFRCAAGWGWAPPSVLGACGSGAQDRGIKGRAEAVPRDGHMGNSRKEESTAKGLSQEDQEDGDDVNRERELKR